MCYPISIKNQLLSEKKIPFFQVNQDFTTIHILVFI